MKKLVVLTVALAASCSPYMTKLEKESKAWATMCNLAKGMEYSCDGITPPQVVYEPMEEGLLGYYEGNDTIFVNSELQGNDKMAVLIHEMVHYLHARLGIYSIPGPASEVCQSEDEAWLIEGVWWGSIGKPKNVNLNWWYSYPHCWPYFAPTNSLTIMILDFFSIEEVWIDFAE